MGKTYQLAAKIRIKVHFTLFGPSNNKDVSTLQAELGFDMGEFGEFNVHGESNESTASIAFKVCVT